MKKGIGVLSFFLILYIPYIVHGQEVTDIIKETEQIAITENYSVFDACSSFLSGNVGFTFSGVVEGFLSFLFSGFKHQSSALVQVAATAAISGIAASFGGKKNDVGMIACVAAVSVLSLKTYLFAAELVEETIEKLFLFMQSFLPAVAAASAATGAVAGTAALGTVFVSMQVFIYICKAFFLPLVSTVTALSIANNFCKAPFLQGVIAFLKGILTWGSGLLITLYSGVTTLQLQAAGTFDSLTGKTVKYAVGNAIPVVGNALSDSMSILASSAKAVKGALGFGGVLGISCLCASPLLQLLVLMFSYKLVGSFCFAGANGKLTSSVEAVCTGLLHLFIVLLSVGVMFFISIALLCRMGGAIA